MWMLFIGTAIYTSHNHKLRCKTKFRICTSKFKVLLENTKFGFIPKPKWLFFTNLWWMLMRNRLRKWYSHFCWILKLRQDTDKPVEYILCSRLAVAGLLVAVVNDMALHTAGNAGLHCLTLHKFHKMVEDL